MFSLQLLLAAALTATTTTLAQSPAAIIKVEASHGGAGQALTNKTLQVPLNAAYTNPRALSAVSTLYLVDAVGSLPEDSISCQPFKNEDGTGDAGLTFYTGHPSRLSTNTVPVGSIVCITSHVQQAPGGGGGGMSLSLDVPSSSSMPSKTRSQQQTATSTSRVQTTQSSASAEPTSTSTSGDEEDDEPTGTSSGAGFTAPTDNGAASLLQGEEVFAGLALAGFGVAFAL